MIENITLSKLKLLKHNPRRITQEQMGKLIKSLEDDPDFLQKRPVLVSRVDDVYEVYAGNQRVSAARKLGWKTIPCIIDVDLDEKVMKSRVIRDNYSNGSWDWEALGNDFDPVELLEWGFDEKELHLDFGDDEDKKKKLADTPEKKEEPKLCPHCGEQL